MKQPFFKSFILFSLLTVVSFENALAGGGSQDTSAEEASSKAALPSQSIAAQSIAAHSMEARAKRPAADITPDERSEIANPAAAQAVDPRIVQVIDGMQSQQQDRDRQLKIIKERAPKQEAQFEDHKRRMTDLQNNLHVFLSAGSEKYLPQAQQLRETADEIKASEAQMYQLQKTLYQHQCVQFMGVKGLLDGQIEAWTQESRTPPTAQSTPGSSLPVLQLEMRLVTGELSELERNSRDFIRRLQGIQKRRNDIYTRLTECQSMIDQHYLAAQEQTNQLYVQNIQEFAQFQPPEGAAPLSLPGEGDAEA